MLAPSQHRRLSLSQVREEINLISSDEEQDEPESAVDAAIAKAMEMFGMSYVEAAECARDAAAWTVESRLAEKATADADHRFYEAWLECDLGVGVVDRHCPILDATGSYDLHRQTFTRVGDAFQADFDALCQADFDAKSAPPPRPDDDPIHGTLLTEKDLFATGGRSGLGGWTWYGYVKPPYRWLPKACRSPIGYACDPGVDPSRLKFGLHKAARKRCALEMSEKNKDVALSRANAPPELLTCFGISEILPAKVILVDLRPELAKRLGLIHTGSWFNPYGCEAVCVRFYHERPTLNRYVVDIKGLGEKLLDPDNLALIEGGHVEAVASLHRKRRRFAQNVTIEFEDEEESY